MYACVRERVRVCCERRIRVALVEREEANRLHYANAVQLQLTVAKNRCRYRGMLSRIPRGGFYTLLLSFGHSSPLFLSLSPTISLRSSRLSISLCVTLVPGFELHPGRIKWCLGCRSNRCFPIRAVRCRKSPSRYVSQSLPVSSFLSPRSLFLFSCVEDALITRLFSRSFP